MKWLNGYRIKLMLVGFVAAIVIGGGSANADFTFGEPTNLGPTVNSSAGDYEASISADGLSLFFDSTRPGESGGDDLWVTSRASVSDPWGEPVNLGPTVNGSSNDWSPSISADGLELYFNSNNRPGGYGNYDIWVTRRTTKDEAWGEPVNLGPPVNGSSWDGSPSISTDGLELYFNSARGGYGKGDTWVTRRATINAPWGEPVNLGAVVNSSEDENLPFVSADGLSLFFRSERPGGYGGGDIWMTTRATKSDPWGEPVNLGPTVNSSGTEGGPSISADGFTFYFYSNRPGGVGGSDLWQAPIIPIVDFNGDGIVDSSDMCIMVDHWGENYSLCDIGPTPLGDGIVDVHDLTVLSEHLFVDVNDPTLIAHWPLDEAQGVIAYDSVSVCDGTLIGNPVWQPDGGIVAGALQLDGIDDCVSTSPVLNPADGVFSVVAWIKDGAPGQVTISQEGGVDWLMTDTEGNLMTELQGSGRSGKPLQSQTNITDGNWHRIGFVWDGFSRILYVNGIKVAEDTQDSLEGSDNSLYIGTGKAWEAGTYWSGLIDDVRIYNRAVRP